LKTRSAAARQGEMQKTHAIMAPGLEGAISPDARLSEAQPCGMHTGGCGGQRRTEALREQNFIFVTNFIVVERC